MAAVKLHYCVLGWINTPPHTHTHAAPSPRDASGLQLVGDVHVPGPDVKLPLPESQNAAQHRAGVDPDPHVDVVFRTRSDVSEREKVSLWSDSPVSRLHPPAESYIQNHISTNLQMKKRFCC